MTRAATVRVPQGSEPLPTRRPAVVGPPDILAERAGSRRARPFLAAGALYLGIALVAWWHLLAHGFGNALPAGSADPGQEVWFLAWLPHAIGSGTNPFFSHAIFSKSGVNLLDNTSMDLLGLVLAPVTATAGPVAALDLAVLLAPAVSAIGAFTLCRRYVEWSPAAFAGGLFYGFGPFLAGDLRYGHLDLTWLVLPPLIFCCLDSLLVRGARRPVLTGTVLGVLVVGQFFVSTEMLAVTALTASVLALIAVVGWPREVPARLLAAWRGIAVATAIVAASLAYPFWVVVDGPRHVAGPVWHDVGAIATSLASTIEPHGQLAGVSFVSGSNGSYLGISCLVVLLVGTVVLWRSAVLRVALVTAAVMYIASLGYRLHVGHRSLGVPLPAALLGHVPLLDSIVPERFSAMVDLFCGLALAVIVERIRTWERPGSTAARTLTGPAGPPARMLVALAALVGAFAIVPLVAVPRWPYRTAAVRAAPFIATASGVRPSGNAARGAPPVVVLYPDTSSAVSDEMVWQAQHGFSFRMPDGYAIVPGPQRRAVESPPLDALWLVFAAGSVHRLQLPLTATTRRAVRGNLRALGVDDVVVFGAGGGSTAVRRALRETLGPPELTSAGAASWTLRTESG